MHREVGVGGKLHHLSNLQGEEKQLYTKLPTRFAGTLANYKTGRVLVHNRGIGRNFERGLHQPVYVKVVASPLLY